MHLPRASLPTPRHFALSFAALSLVPLAASAAQAAPPPSLDAAIRSPGGGTSEAPVAPASDEASRPIGFSADSVTYDDRADTVTATGDVFLRRDDQSVRADSVTWSRTTGAIVATGHVRMVDANGNETFVHKVSLTDSFAAGTMDDILLVLREGGRVAATQGSRDAAGIIHMTRAAYTACDVVDAKGCPARPSWRITAHKLTYDPERHNLHMVGARMVLFGILRLPLPPLTVATDGRAISGLLIPSASTSATNGLGFDETYYARLAPNRDLALTAYVFTQAAPMASAQYRALNDAGAYQITGYVTRSVVIPQNSTTGIGNKQFRGYIDTNGRFQLSPEWDVSFSGRLASDRTFLSRYYLSNDDVLRSTISAERITPNSTFSIAGWAFETLRAGEAQGQVPIALPEIDYRRRIADPVLGGTLSLQANSLAITRSGGEDTQRAFASAQWNLSRITGLGQVVTLTGLLRGDLTHASSVALADSAIYAGAPGWHARGIALAAVDVTWPLIGQFLGGTQVLTPHLQLVAAPPVPSLAAPNEDSRSIGLEDDNIFALNRYPGFDRIEDGVRLTYGLDWQFERPRWRVLANIGQSARLTSNANPFPQGTGLYDSLSDVVGRVEVRYRDFVKLTERFRIDKSNGAFRRNEFDATIGSDQNYVEVGYARINQGLAAVLNDLQDSNELRAAARASFARHWSLFGSGVFDLSQSQVVDGAVRPVQPLRTRLGFSYRSDCFEFDLTWRKDYVTIGDAVKGSSFMVHISLRNIGLH